MELCRQFMAEISAAGREMPLRPTRYENGDRLEYAMCLRRGGGGFEGFYLLGAIPVLGWFAVLKRR